MQTVRSQNHEHATATTTPLNQTTADVSSSTRSASVSSPTTSEDTTTATTSTSTDDRPDIDNDPDSDFDSSSGDDGGDPPAVAAAKSNPDCTEQSVTDVSEDDRVLVLDDGNRYLIGDDYQDVTSSWEGDDVYYCDGGPGHRYFVNDDGTSVPVGALDE